MWVVIFDTGDNDPVIYLFATEALAYEFVADEFGGAADATVLRNDYAVEVGGGTLRVRYRSVHAA